VNQNIRVAVANQPRLMRELIVATMSDQPDIEVVAEVQEESDIPSVVEKTTPEFLIIALDSQSARPSMCDALLRRYPNMKILALAPDGNWSVFYWASLDIHAVDLETSEASILKALRTNRKVLREDA
jgi:chemotaxis response regulator CheB